MPGAKCAWKGAIALWGLGLGCIGGCASLPESAELRDSAAAYPGGSLPATLDGRARFREIFCQLAAVHGEHGYDAGTCDDFLWLLKDEPAALASPLAPPPLASDLRVFVVSGAFADCRGIDSIPFGREIEQLASQGARIEAVVVSGRSGPQHNARQLAEAIERSDIRPDDRLVLIGYSKGAVDILQFLADFPQLGQQAVSVVSIAGAIFGSPLAATADWWYRNLFADAFAQTCDPGDGLVISSLLPDTRRKWLEEHPLPAGVAFYSLAAFTTEQHLSRGLEVPWRILSSYDRRNDGQLLAGDTVIPGSTLLGYVNADHWDVAISLELQMPYLSSRRSTRPFPRSVLLEATLRYVSESPQ